MFLAALAPFSLSKVDISLIISPIVTYLYSSSKYRSTKVYINFNFIPIDREAKSATGSLGSFEIEIYYS